MRLYIALILFFLSTAKVIWANNNSIPQVSKATFIKNVGQIASMENNQPVADVLYYVSTPQAILYIRKTGLTYLFQKNDYRQNDQDDYPQIEKTHWQRVDVEYVGAALSKVEEEDMVPWQYNFFYAHCPEGIKNVSGYRKLTFKEIYKGIDFKIYFNEKGELKYDFIVSPHADPNQIQLQYKYSNPIIENNDGSILIKNDLGEITENTPYAYQQNNSVEIKWKLLGQNSLTFDIGNYNRNQALTIDPFLLWSTYLGGGNDDISEGVAANGNMIVVAGQTGSSNFPTMNSGGGAYFMGSNSGNNDLFIAKFTDGGVMQWVTYYGGTGSDVKAKPTIVNNQYIYISAQSWSTNMPTFDPGNGAFYKDTLGNPSYADGFIIKFDLNSNLLWATYFGGVYSDETPNIAVTNNAVFTFVTGSSNDMPLVDPGSGAWQQSISNNNENVYIAKFNISDNNLTWGTYFSTASVGIGNGWNQIACSPTHLFMALNVKDLDAPIVNPLNGAYCDSSYNGGLTDALICKFSENGVLEWSTYYGGVGTEDIRGICVANNKLWIAGSTNSNNFPVFDPGNGAYVQSTYGGGSYDGIIASFDLNGQLLWSTYYGGNQRDDIRDIKGDNYGVFVTGRVVNSGLPLYNNGTSGFFESNAKSIFIGKFKQNGKRQWMTYFSGTAGEGRKLAVTNDAVYLTGYINGTLLTNDLGNGAYFQPGFAGGTWDAFIAKFDRCVIPNVNITVSQSAICNFDSTWLYGHGDDVLAYNWSTLATTDSIHVSPNVTTTYTVTITDDMACSNSADTTIIVYPLPNVTITAEHPICIGDSITLYANGAQTYIWTPINVTADSISVAPLNTTTYYVLGTDTNNCKNIDSAQVIVNPLPNVFITGEHPICFRDSITLYGNGAQTYLWSPNALAGDSIEVSPSNTTTFYILGTDSNGCKNIDSAEVVVYPLPNVQIVGEHPICFGDSIKLYAQGANTYIWTPGNYTIDSIQVAPFTTTYYYLLGTDTNQCKNIDSAEVVVYSLPNVQIVGEHPICFGDSITLSATGALTYVWYPDTLQGPSQIFSPDTTSFYILEGTDFHQCKNTDTATVVVYALPNVQILGAHPICYGDFIDLTAVNAEHYVWNTLDTTASIHVNPSQTFDFIVVGTDTNGCVNSDTSQVIVNPLPPVRIFGVHPICHYDSISISAFGANTYTWVPWGYHDTTITVSPDSTTNITLIGIDGNGCVNSDSATLVVYPLPNVSVTGVHPICMGDSITLTAHGAYSYQWIPVNMNGEQITISPTQTDNYTVLGTDTNQCKNTADFSITVYELPVANITGINRICQQEMVTLTASGGDSYIWNTAETSTSIDVMPMQTTTYSVIAIKNICSDTAYFTLNVDPKPTLTLTHDTTIIIGMSLPLQVSGAHTYIWTPVTYLSCTSCNNPNTRPSETIEYCVEGINTFGCSDTACVVVTVDKECGETFVPSAFSPNGDGNNDILYVRGKCIKSMNFTIFNRWGEKVFESYDPDNGWDGTFRGKELDTGVFVYVLKAEYYNGVIINQKGNITLVR
ncbi:MAG: gliding motility-associated C-terminal domain-containing protein [Bacteroidales bacterium]|nr:gliding motility-associated C-terminal domain-containing protein [Bacteroidales bacterium]